MSDVVTQAKTAVTTDLSTEKDGLKHQDIGVLNRAPGLDFMEARFEINSVPGRFTVRRTDDIITLDLDLATNHEALAADKRHPGTWKNGDFTAQFSSDPNCLELAELRINGSAEIHINRDGSVESRGVRFISGTDGHKINNDD